MGVFVLALMVLVQGSSTEHTVCSVEGEAVVLMPFLLAVFLGLSRSPRAAGPTGRSRPKGKADHRCTGRAAERAGCSLVAVV